MEEPTGLGSLGRCVIRALRYIRRLLQMELSQILRCSQQKDQAKKERNLRDREMRQEVGHWEGEELGGGDTQGPRASRSPCRTLSLCQLRVL